MLITWLLCSLINFHLLRWWKWGEGGDPRDELAQGFSAAESVCAVRVSVKGGDWWRERRGEERDDCYLGLGCTSVFWNILKTLQGDFDKTLQCEPVMESPSHCLTDEKTQGHRSAVSDGELFKIWGKSGPGTFFNAKPRAHSIFISHVSKVK